VRAERRKDYGFAVKCRQCSRRALFTRQRCRDCRRQINAGQVHMLTIMLTPKHQTTAFHGRRLIDYLFEQWWAPSGAVVAFLRFWRPLQMSRLTYLLTYLLRDIQYTTVHVLDSSVIITLLHVAIRRLLAFDTRCSRRILQVCRKDEVSNAIVREKVGRHCTTEIEITW